MIFHVANLRQNYAKADLNEADLAENPLRQFAAWFQEASTAPEIREPNAMVLSTADSEGRSSSRMVLLKDFDETTGFTFFTNYTSQKATELMATGFASLVFWWEPLERQVRVEGPVEKLPPEQSDRYFASRPRQSQLGAWASPQSEAIANRAVLEERFKTLETEYGDRPIPRPEHWGGFLIRPDKMEFWQGRPSRLHDRFVFQRQADGSWKQQRLAP